MGFCKIICICAYFVVPLHSNYKLGKYWSEKYTRTLE